MPRKVDGERQPDITKADHANSHIGKDRQTHLFPSLERKDRVLLAM